jgi:putative transposase
VAAPPTRLGATDDTPLQPVEPEALRLSLLEERRSYKVHPKGIHFRNVWYTALGSLAPHVGSKVEVRYMPRDSSFIEVFYEGDWVCTAYPNSTCPTRNVRKFREAGYPRPVSQRSGIHQKKGASEERK